MILSLSCSAVYELFGEYKQIHVIHAGSGLISELVQGFDYLPQNCGLYVMYL